MNTEELQRQQIKFYTLLNGYLSAGALAFIAWIIYKLVGIFV